MRAIFNRVAKATLTNPVADFVFRHSDKVCAYPFMACDATLMAKDLIASGTVMSTDTLSGAFFVASSVALKFSKQFPRVAFRANGLLLYSAIASLMASGLGYGGVEADAGKFWAGINFIPGATLTLFEDEIGRAATYLRARSNNAFSRLLSSVSRYPLIWSAGFNLIGTVGILQSGLANPEREWPLLAVAALATAGNIGLMACDRRLEQTVMALKAA